MNLWFRVIMVWIRALFRSKLTSTDISITPFVVLPHDIDINIHLNNGRYLTFMDLGRLDFTVRMGLARLFFKKSWVPVVASVGIRFRKSIGLFKKFELHTKIVGFDDRFVYIEQDFVIGTEVFARGLVKACFLHKGKMISMDLVASELGSNTKLPPPDWIQSWNEVDKLFFKRHIP
jgi:acyl-CoA thioesterase FadM